MANTNHLELLTQGVEAWNLWRKRNPDLVPDLSEAYTDVMEKAKELGLNVAARDLHGINLNGADAQRSTFAGANLERADLRGANFRGSNLSGVNFLAVDLRQANLQEADLHKSDFEDAQLTGVNLQKADLRKCNLPGADLGGADLRGANLQEALLAGANLQDSQLTMADLQKAELLNALLNRVTAVKVHFGEAQLAGADLREANLREANLEGANLEGATLRDADLRGTNISTVAGGLQPDQLAGADLTNAKLPDALNVLFKDLKAVSDISESARKLFITMLAACLYSWLTIATTTDVNLITNRASSPLPIIQASIPIVGFYIVAPMLLLCLYFYFHFYLQKLWEELGSLPAMFPDGRRLHERSDPWLLNDLVRSHVARLKAGRPFMSYFQQAISVVLAWWLVPATLGVFWMRYLRRHDFYGTTLHILLLAISISAAARLHRLTVATLRGAVRQPFSWIYALKDARSYRSVGAFVAVGCAFMLLSVGAIRGVAPGKDPWWQNGTPGAWGWVPRAMAIVGYSPFANVVQADVSIKPTNWTGKKDDELDLVTGARLMGTDLRYASASGVFLAKANLEGAELEGASFDQVSDLRGADLKGAHLDRANLSSADLTAANLQGAHLQNANLTAAKLIKSDLSSADLSGAKLNEADMSELDLTSKDINLCNFSLSKAILRNVKLTMLDLKGFDFSGADLSGADLTRADLQGANLMGAQLIGAHLSRANLTGANLSVTDLSGADLSYADLSSANLEQATMDKNVNLDGAELKYADFMDVDSLFSGIVVRAHNWKKAYYFNGYFEQILGLDSDYDDKLKAEEQEEAKHKSQPALRRYVSLRRDCGKLKDGISNN